MEHIYKKLENGQPKIEGKQEKNNKEIEKKVKYKKEKRE